MNRLAGPRNLSTGLRARIIERPIGYPHCGVREASLIVISAAVWDIARRSDRRSSSGSGSVETSVVSNPCRQNAEHGEQCSKMISK